MDAISKRLMKELIDYEKEAANHPEILSLQPIDDEDLTTWVAQIAGLPDTPYEGGVFDLLIKIPQNYPMHPPTITFTTTLCHPNVHLKTGEICLDILKTAWSPAWTLKSTVLAISLLLYNPEPSSPLNCDAANLLRCDDILGYNSLVRMYTQLYSVSNTSSSQ
ncbi:ubiquitin-conjugating enzyme/RWD-like protein [Halteromyces radiatus]|uniref:ubiquitin-conjugating enzyme/RWD-like protein n=1 Tax=Halteromyces radiatus TaxID=101107 RepID=UPI00221F1206|nr:ubiquitin-conjugating enzyme/RWD-like protein [Halteromyces radiatus]KAI8078914.1 ubiquitin-conjugating enzyme/RWD-like protein [Halteromyces radiatus]